MRIKKRDLRGDSKLGEYAEKGNSAKFYVDEHDICNGAVKLLRTKQSGDVWQMRCWITEEKKYIKKSLRTKDLETAKEKGRKLYYTLMGHINAGSIMEYNVFKKNVFSQNGEDGILEEIIKRVSDVPIEQLQCVEFGAWDGKKFSNTFNFVMQGGSAVYIEGSKRKFQKLKKTAKKFTKNYTD